jgi:hypothetical protein
MKMIKIDLDTKLLVGDTVYSPISKKYFQIVDLEFKEIYKEIIVSLKAVNNSDENGFTIRLSGIISYGYYII